MTLDVGGGAAAAVVADVDVVVHIPTELLLGTAKFGVKLGMDPTAGAADVAAVLPITASAAAAAAAAMACCCAALVICRKKKASYQQQSETEGKAIKKI